MNSTSDSAKHTILIIDDRPDDLKLMANCLEKADFKVMTAQNGESGLDTARRVQPDLILLDVLMPGIDGFETCRRLKAEASVQEIPVIFMTSLAETEHKITGFEVGGVDYITKPIQVAEVLARVKAHLAGRVLQKQLEAQNVQLQQEIAERKRAAQKEEEQLQFLQTLLNTIPNPIFYKNTAGRYTGCNKAFEDFIGKPAEAIIGHTVYDMGPKEIADKYHEKDLELLENPGKQHYEWQVVGKGGKIREVFFDKATLMNASGQVDGLIGVISDITELKQAEQALRESEERLLQIASSLREVIWLRDVQTRQVLYVNPAFEALTGRTCESFYENRDIVIDTIHPDDKEWVSNALEQRFEDVPFDKEHRIIHLDGSVRWVSSRIFPVRNEAGEVYRWASIMEDITERKQAEQALQTRTHELGERVKELNCLYGIANLIQTPDISLADILQGVVALIPAAWQYPQITCAQIIIEGQVSAKTENFAVTPWQLTAPIIVHGEPIGVVEVGYLEEKPARNKVPFLPEERRLLNAIAERLGRIIEQLRAEETLHETEAKWRSLAETAPATIATLDRQGTILFINRPLLAEGLPKLVIGSSIYKYLSPQEQQRTRKIIEGVFQSGGVVRYETTAISSDGSEVCVENRIAPIKIGSQIVAATYMALDITTRKQAEERLRQANNLRISSDQPTPKLH